MSTSASRHMSTISGIHPSSESQTLCTRITELVRGDRFELTGGGEAADVDWVCSACWALVGRARTFAFALALCW